MTDRQMDICDSRVTFVAEKILHVIWFLLLKVSLRLMKLTIRSYDPFLSKITSHCIKSVVLHKVIIDDRFLSKNDE